MEKIRRNERMSAMMKILADTPNHIFTLSYFCEMFGAAKSTMSEDIDILRNVVRTFGLGELETVTGAAGGVRYRTRVSRKDAREYVQSLCEELSGTQRVLPGGYLYINDILFCPQQIGVMGRLLASQFYKQSPDFVLTVETKGIALAMATADALGISCVVARRGQQSEMEWPYVSLNYISGTSGKLQTMSVTKKLVHEGQRALIVDDYMKAGGTAKAMMERMREFTNTVEGVGMMLSRETEAKKQVEDVKSLMIIKDVHEELGANVVPAPWLS